jgi:hypothetical protein
MVSGSVSDERAFSAMNFIKNDLRNRLDTNLEACLLVYMQNLFITAIFPYGELQERLKSMYVDHRMHQTAERVQNFEIFVKRYKKPANWILSLSKRNKKLQNGILSLVKRHKESNFRILSLDKRHTEKGFGDHCCRFMVKLAHEFYGCATFHI